VVNIVLEGTRGAGYTEVRDEVFEEAEPSNKRYLLFVPGGNPDTVKRRGNI
jgi:hypothetical protein